MPIGCRVSRWIRLFLAVVSTLVVTQTAGNGRTPLFAAQESMTALTATDEIRLFEQGAFSPQVACTLRWQGLASFIEEGSLAGGYRLAAYQDPGADGCPGPYPFGVTDVWWTVYFQVDVPVQIQLLILQDTGTVACPTPGGTIYSSPVYILNVPAIGPWIIRIPLGDTVCVSEPYFAGVRVVSPIDTGVIDILIDATAPLNCRTYRDTSNGWSDLVIDDGFVHNMQLWSAGLDQSQNGCPVANQCPSNVAASPDPVNATVGSSASATVTASDPDGGGPLEYFLVSGPGSVNSTSGVWMYTPTCEDTPGFTVTVEASDRGAGGCPQSQVSFQVNVTAPLLSLGSCATVSVHWGDTAYQQLTSSGGCPPVAFTKLSGPGTVTSEGSWSNSTDCGDVGIDSVTIRATDAEGQTSLCTFEVAVTNMTPHCQSPVAANAPHGTLAQVPLGPAIDPDGDTLVYVLVSGPAWGGVNGTNWVATRPINDSADYTVCYSINDGCATATQCCFLVTETCQCECHADPQCDAATDILDVILTVNRAFRGASAIPFCPGQTLVDGRTDVDCTGGTDVVDVVKMIDVAFRGADPVTRFCEPCGP